MRVLSVYILIALFFLNVSAYAFNHLYVGGTVGANNEWIDNHSPSILYHDETLLDEYPLRNRHNTSFLLGLNGGFEFEGNHFIPALELGLGLYATPGENRYHGQLIETAIGDPSSTLYDYRFKLNSIRLMVETQFTWSVNQFLPFISVGIGSAWNRLYGYKENPIDSTGYVALPPFKSYNNNNFAYQLGFGLGYAFNIGNNYTGHCHDRVALAYRYVDVGNVKFGIRGSDYPYQLKFRRLNNHEIYLNYTHLM